LLRDAADELEKRSPREFDGNETIDNYAKFMAGRVIGDGR
jgi:hypothetical protein